jgi:hypothetical protein
LRRMAALKHSMVFSAIQLPAATTQFFHFC